MPAGSESARIKAFADYWNLQLTFNSREAARLGKPEKDVHVRIDWKKIGEVLAREAAQLAKLDQWQYEGINVYASYNPATEADKGFHKWITTWLNSQPGVIVRCLERQPKAPPKCPSCHRPIATCPHVDCGKPFKATVEKGVDTLLATDMIKLAWESAYDIAVVTSLDRDLIPAVEFLTAKGKKVIHAGFPPLGSHITQACWAHFDILALRNELVRPDPKDYNV